jgi:outer membrane protein TolC
MRRICCGARVFTRSEELRLIVFGFLILICPSNVVAAPQEAPSPQVSGGTQHEAENPTPLAALIDEAKRNDPALHVAESAARAASFGASQMSALPDPQFTLQQFSVGSPRPFAGYTNSDFAYIGLGASQRFPYPGKRKLRGDVADRDADTNPTAPILRVCFHPTWMS